MMAENLNEKELESVKRMIMTILIEIEALVKLLVEKGVITGQEFSDEKEAAKSRWLRQAESVRR